jgi:hypothetical protein
MLEPTVNTWKLGAHFFRSFYAVFDIYSRKVAFLDVRKGLLAPEP